MIADLHVHTSYSMDSNADMEAYVRTAIDRGIDALCFTDHIECGNMFHSFSTFDYAGRAELFNTLKARYGNHIKLLLGVEFGEPHLWPKELQFIHTLGLDMIIGSIHHPMDLQLNNPQGQPNSYYEKMYGEYVLDMVNHGGFDVVGHIDMPKRYNAGYTANIEQLQQILRLCVERDLVPEMNTSSVRQKGLEPMPDIDMIAYYRSVGGVYVTVNSDSHFVADVGSDITSTIARLPRGIKRCYYENRKRIEI